MEQMTLLGDDPGARYRYRQAVISEDQRYRYELIIRWNTGPTLEWIMLNPSTADQTNDDPTIRRCINFAVKWGYACIVVRNLYALRSPDPSALVNADDPIGPLNRAYLTNNIAACTIAAWGAHPAATGWWNGYPYAWQRTAIKRPNLRCLGVNMNGSPKHPLYVPADTSPTPWTPPC